MTQVVSSCVYLLDRPAPIQAISRRSSCASSVQRHARPMEVTDLTAALSNEAFFRRARLPELELLQHQRLQDEEEEEEKQQQQKKHKKALPRRLLSRFSKWVCHKLLGRRPMAVTQVPPSQQGVLVYIPEATMQHLNSQESLNLAAIPTESKYISAV